MIDRAPSTLFLATLALACAACASDGDSAGDDGDNIEAPVTGGAAAPQGQLTSTVRTSTASTCSATRVGPRQLLTAAHCVPGDSADVPDAYHIITNRGDTLQEAAFTVHYEAFPTWQSNGNFVDSSHPDLALLTLNPANQPAEDARLAAFLDGDQAIPMVPLAASAPTIEQDLDLAGWAGGTLNHGVVRVTEWNNIYLYTRPKIGQGCTTAQKGDSGGSGYVLRADGGHALLGVLVGSFGCSTSGLGQAQLGRVDAASDARAWLLDHAGMHYLRDDQKEYAVPPVDTTWNIIASACVHADGGVTDQTSIADMKLALHHRDASIVAPGACIPATIDLAADFSTLRMEFLSQPRGTCDEILGVPAVTFELSSGPNQVTLTDSPNGPLACGTPGHPGRTRYTLELSM